MINLVLDTSILRNDPQRKKAAFKTISRLSVSEKLRLHIPYFVKEEFISQEINEYLKHIGQIKSAVSALNRRPLPKDKISLLDNLLRNIEPFENDIAEYVNSAFNEWVKESRVETHQIEPHHGKRVAQSYFEGSFPFREKKRRDDIPDAFIWESILDLLSEHETICVISADKGILKACRKQEKIIEFSSLDDFVASEVCQSLLKEHYGKENSRNFVELIIDNSDIVKEAIGLHLVDDLAGKMIHSYELAGEEDEATVLSVGEPQDIELFPEDSEYYGEGLIVLPFSLEVECLLYYSLFKADFYILDDERAEKISISELNDHFFDAEEDYNLRVEGVLSIQVKAESLEMPEIEDEQMIDMLMDAEIQIDSISEIEIMSDISEY